MKEERNASDYIEMAEGKLGRVIVVRLRPGVDVLLNLEKVCKEITSRTM